MKFKSAFLLSLLALPLFAARAQTYSSNGVGYVNVMLTPGYNMIANPLIAADNSIGALFQNIQGGVPDGTTVFKFKDGSFLSAQYDALENIYSGNAADETTVPGEGVWVFVPGNSNHVLTFVGQLQQGDVCTDIPHGFSIKSSAIAMSGTLEQMQFPAFAGDVVYVWNSILRNFTAYSPDLGSYPPMSPIPVGHSFFVYHAGADTTWCRTFFVNVPQ